MSLIRSPICTVVGHVDHGKSSLLDFIRGSNIVTREAGAITQAIGASVIPMDAIQKKAGTLLSQMGIKVQIPSLLFIDTPGHAAFTNLRKRGGNLADIAIVVIDINEGIMPQTQEALQILINYKTPFIIALNKIDLLAGFSVSQKSLKVLLEAQQLSVQELFETKMYGIVGKLHELFGLSAERFDRVDDFTKQVAMVPISAKLGVGIPELLMMIMGLAQRYLSAKLVLDPAASAKGTVLEVKNEKGVGTVLDVILYDGHLKINDTLVVGGLDAPVVTKVKGLLEPLPLTEIMDKKARFTPVKQVVAAAGVRIIAKGIDHVVAGMPVRSGEDVDGLSAELMQEISEVTIDTDKEGIILKADSLGSLEALIGILRDKGIKIAKASVGRVNKSDVIDAHASKEKSPFYGVVLGFNVDLNDDAQMMVKDYGITPLCSNVIYHLVDAYDAWVAEEKVKIERKKMQALPPVGRIELLQGYVFRQNNPAVVGVEVLEGSIRTTMPLMNDEGVHLADIKSIQKEKDSVTSAKTKEQVAVSLPGVTVGRQIKEGDILFTFLSESEFRAYKEFKDCLSGDEKTVLKMIAEIMRRENPVWGV